MDGAPLPIDSLLPDILRSLAEHPRLVLEAPPGAGKTTRVPPALLAAPWRGEQRILMLEPRRVAARAAASFMAEQCGEAVGETIGYRIRFDNRSSARTRIEVVTEGILTRMIQDDPSLEGVAALLFDEFHERHLSADLGLALALDVQAQLRPDLRIVVMSATLDGERLARLIDARQLVSMGRSFPVQISHLAAARGERDEAQVQRAVRLALAEHAGDVLVFLPGQREIARLQRLLEQVDAEVLALHGELPVEQQAAVLRADPNGRRRVVLATNVAESSVTLPGVRVVIDSGQAREPRYDPNSGFSRLSTVTISQASADQRTGRAGRVAAGWCIRLWPQSQRLEPQRRAEMGQVELAGLALELAAWGSSELCFVDTPPPGAMAAATELLQTLGALDGKSITTLGRRMLGLGTHPRLAAMLCADLPPVERALACDLAALIESRDPMTGLRSDDLGSRWHALLALRAGRMVNDANRGALAAIERLSAQWRRRLRVDPAPADLPTHTLGDVLRHAFPDRIARQHPQDPRRYQLANGRSVRLWDDSALFGEPWLLVTDLQDADRDARVQRAVSLDIARLERECSALFVTEDRVFWDADARRIAATRERRFARIVIESKPLATPDRARFAEALLDAVRQLGLAALGFSESLAQWRERVRCVHAWRPELALPAFDDADLLNSLEHWLQPVLEGKTKLDTLDAEGVAEAMKSRLDWATRQRIDALAPPRIQVPSGQSRSVLYQHGEAPVLAVKLQELFGLADTPRIDDGRLAVTLHLLSPGGRPLQVTQDLRGFWERTYPEVRKEMKGRYPRHPWPDDPWSATPTHRAKPRGT